MAAAAAAASWAWRGLLGCAARAVEGLPLRLQPEPAVEGVFSVLVLLAASLSLLVWNAPYACLYFMRARGRASVFDSYLIQPPSSSSKANKGQPSSWWEYGDAASTMAAQLLFLGATLAWGGGSRAILYYRPDWRAALEGYWAATHGSKGASAAAAAAAAMALPSSWPQMLREILVCLVIEDAGFYWMHRLLHHPRLYAAFHKTHHRYKAPFSLCSTYASLLDFALGDSVPLTLAVMLACSSLASVMVCVSARLFLTTEIHSGYTFPWSVDTLLRRLLRSGRRDWLYAGSRHHDAHHEKTHGNYGSSFAFWDLLCNTYIEPEGKGAGKGQKGL